MRQSTRRAAPARFNPAPVPPIYVTGHRNPDTDSIASAIGYAELKGRLDPRNEYVAGAPGRVQPPDALGAGAQRRPRARAPPPRDAARDRRHADRASRSPATTSRSARPGWPWPGPSSSSCRSSTTPARSSAWSPSARSPAATSASPATPRRCRRPPPRSARSSRCSQGELVVGADRELAGPRVGALDGRRRPSGIQPGDVAVMGNRTDAQRLAIELGAALLVLSNDSTPDRARSSPSRRSTAPRSSSRRWTPTCPDA